MSIDHWTEDHQRPSTMTIVDWALVCFLTGFAIGVLLWA